MSDVVKQLIALVWIESFLAALGVATGDIMQLGAWFRAGVYHLVVHIQEALHLF